MSGSGSNKLGELRRAERAVRDGERTARAFTEAPGYVATLVDAEGDILDVNEAMTVGLRKEPHELTGTNGRELLPPELRPLWDTPNS